MEDFLDECSKLDEARGKAKDLLIELVRSGSSPRDIFPRLSLLYPSEYDSMCALDMVEWLKELLGTEEEVYKYLTKAGWSPTKKAQALRNLDPQYCQGASYPNIAHYLRKYDRLPLKEIAFILEHVSSSYLGVAKSLCGIPGHCPVFTEKSVISWIQSLKKLSQDDRNTLKILLKVSLVHESAIRTFGNKVPIKVLDAVDDMASLLSPLPPTHYN